MLPKQEDNTCPYCEELKRQLVIVQQENQKLRYEVERLRKALENISFNAAREDYKPCVHAEQNAICLCAKRGLAVQGGTMYVNADICLTCAKLIVSCAISRVVIRRDYHSEEGIEFLWRHGVQIDIWPPMPKNMPNFYASQGT